MDFKARVLFLYIVTYETYVTCKDCTKIDMCSCSFDDGSGKVDLTSLGNKDDTPRFKDVLYSNEGYYYSYNPCGGFKEGTCSNAAVCVTNQDKSAQTQIGDATSPAFRWDDEKENVVVIYVSGTGMIRISTVNLICDPNALTPTFESEGQQALSSEFEMTLTSVCACPGMCGPSGPTSSSGSNPADVVSGRSILLIVFFSIVAVYIVVGIIFCSRAKQRGRI